MAVVTLARAGAEGSEDQAALLAPPGITARVDVAERWRSRDQWGDLGATALAAVLQAAADGDTRQIASLVEYAIKTDPHLASLYTTRITRVAQADYEVVPNAFGNPQLAELAAEFVNEQLGRLENFDQTTRDLLHAVALGFSVGENQWERDSVARTWYVQRIHWRHPTRFRYGPGWNLRLHDGGRRPGADSYGELLNPDLFIVHEHKEVAGYPGGSGVMHACLWTWMFKRWVSKFWIAHLEKHGSPLVYAKVKPKTPREVRSQLLENLQNLAADHVAVLEDGTDIVVEAAAAAATSSQHEPYLKNADAGLTKAWLGIADAVDPGANGSNAAVSTRTGAAMDPRMVADGKNYATTIRGSLFKSLIGFNRHKFGEGVDPSSIPLPELRMKTAHDEVKTDAGAAAEEMRGVVPEVGRGMGGEAPDLAAIVRQSLDAAAEDRKQLSQAMVMLSQSVIAMQQRSAPDPKAGAAARPRRTRGRTPKTSPTTRDCPSPLAMALLGESDESAAT